MATPLFLCAGVHVILQREGNVFLLLRQNTSFGNGQYCFPEGRMMPGESPRQAAARELKEEAGISVDPEALRFGFVLYEEQRSTNTFWVRFFFPQTRTTASHATQNLRDARRQGGFRSTRFRTTFSLLTDAHSKNSSASRCMLNFVKTESQHKER